MDSPFGSPSLVPHSLRQGFLKISSTDTPLHRHFLKILSTISPLKLYFQKILSTKNIADSASRKF